MTTLRRLLAISTLIVFLAGIALAGDTLTPPIAAPPPAECTSDCSGIAASPTPTAEDLSVDIAKEATMFATWLAMSIL